MSWVTAEELQSATGEPVIPGMVGNSRPMQEVNWTVRKAANSRASVLLLGETGTGKELVATALHRLSSRASGPLVKVNCGALSENLLESELFGHVRGAFTGAFENRTGRFEAAHTGTIFLDEINSTGLSLQVKLLRVLQEREFERVGTTETLQVDARVIAASNCDLWEQVEKKEFREDLYWRLNVIPITIPPLRKRKDDIPPLVGFFLNHYSSMNSRKIDRISAEAMDGLQKYSWPGNVRELQNYVERAIVMSEGGRLERYHFPDHIYGDGNDPEPEKKPESKARLEDFSWDQIVNHAISRGLKNATKKDEDLLEQVIGRFEFELIQQILKRTGGIQAKAAKVLGINRNTLHKKIKTWNPSSTKADEKALS